ncbi:MAG TPA: hypothetical protein VKA68_06045, partial [bacterium]|nr:hypothetical protein [bacterium]
MKYTTLLNCLAVTLFYCLFGGTGYAQDAQGRVVPFQVGVQGFPGFPMGAFRENVERIGVGASGHFLYNIPR